MAIASVVLNTFGPHDDVVCSLEYDTVSGVATRFICVNNSPYPAEGRILRSNGTWSSAFTFTANHTSQLNIPGSLGVTVDPTTGDLITAPTTSFSWPIT